MMISKTAPLAAQVVLGLLSAATWGGADFAGGLAARRGRPSQVILIAHGISLLLLLLLRRPAAMSTEAVLLGLLSGVAGGVALMLFYQALAQGGMGISASLAGLLTAALPVSLALLQQGSPGRTQLAGFAAAAIAIVFIAWSPGERSRPRTLGLAALAGVGFGMQLVLLHTASANGSVLGALTFSRLGGVSCGAAVIIARAVQGLRRQAPAGLEPAAGMFANVKGLQALISLAALAGLLDTAGNGLYMGAALLGRLDIAAVLSSLYPGATILLAATILKERTSGLQAFGMALALAAVVLISI